jgi:hypothetical protein
VGALKVLVPGTGWITVGGQGAPGQTGAVWVGTNPPADTTLLWYDTDEPASDLITVGPVAPSTPTVNDVWIDTT